MSPKNEKTARRPERRRHQRFPVMEGMIEPITVNFDKEPEVPKAPGGPRNQPALLTNLSAGGMSLLVFLEPPHTKRLEMLLTIPGLNHIPIEGKVVRVHEKGQTYSVGIAFTRIGKKDQIRINGMAQDHMDCETRISLQLPEVCVRNCTFHALCAKPQKGPYWPKK